MFDYLHLREKRALQFATPDEFICPITLEIMNQPVVSPSGFSYERSAILSALMRSPVDPIAGSSLSADQLYPNTALRNAIELFRSADASIESLVRRTILFAISGSSANPEIGEPMLRGLRHEGYFDVAKDSNLHVQLREQFQNNRLYEHRSDDQERMIRRIALKLQSHIIIDDTPKTKQGFSLSRISKGRLPFFKEVTDVKHRVHFDLKMKLIPAEVRAIVESSVAEIAALRSASAASSAVRAAS